MSQQVTCPANEIVVRENQPPIFRDNLRLTSKVAVVHVINGGVIKRSSVVTLIDDGGIVNSIDYHSPMVLVKNGGVLAQAANHSAYRSGLLFHEPSARLGVELLNPKVRWTNLQMELCPVMPN